MKRNLILALSLLCAVTAIQAKTPKKTAAVQDLFPDGTPVPEWFKTTEPIKLESLGKQYVLTDYRILPDGAIHTTEIQALIDKAAEEGGGVIVVPSGTFKTGGLDFRQGTHLYLEEGATLMGSDFIGDYPLRRTRIEGETCMYFGALINADGLDGFTISGKGTIDGNGLHYHQAFWLRRMWNWSCTNKDEQRPRLIYISNCKNVQIENVSLQNSAFWTTHVYNSEYVKILNLHINSFGKPAGASGPSTDALDLDVVKNIHVKGCYISVNDDGIAMKGGKGPWADDPTKSEGNGGNENVIIEDCDFGPATHSCLTLGSESVYDHNVVMRNCRANCPDGILFRLKMRGDTPQQYEYTSVENCTGYAKYFFYVQPWTQFFDLKGRQDPPMSYGDHISMKNCDFECEVFFNVSKNEDQYLLTNFNFENLNVKARTKPEFHSEYVENFTIKNVSVTQ